MPELYGRIRVSGEGDDRDVVRIIVRRTWRADLPWRTK